jgi:NAD(P)H-quinone oxidoreductase subunit 5
LGAGFMMVIGLTLLATLLQLLDFGTEDLSNQFAGNIVMFGMMLMYVLLVLIQKYPNTLVKFQRWSYAGFYLDEYYTRLTLKLWPINWASTNKISSKE